MTFRETVWQDWQQKFTRVFLDIEREVQTLSPQTSMIMGYSCNPSFPFRAYATYRSLSSAYEVDVSIDCQFSNELLLISVDIAYAEGLLLTQWKEWQVHRKLVGIEAALEDVYQEVEQYLKEQPQLISKALQPHQVIG